MQALKRTFIAATLLAASFAATAAFANGGFSESDQLAQFTVAQQTTQRNQGKDCDQTASKPVVQKADTQRDTAQDRIFAGGGAK